MKAKRRSKPQRLSLDLITTLPPAIIETILCLLPIEEAARTSILSRDWRYKWTTIPKLVFDSYIVPQRTSRETQTSELASATENMDDRCKLFYAIHQVLLLHQGPIHEFTLSMEADRHYFEIDQIILHLSRNHALKKLTLDLYNGVFYKLPLCAFSLHYLTDLVLENINLDHQPIFNGYGNLRSLRLDDVIISTKTLVHLLSNSPLITSFTLSTDELTGDTDCTILELFECLPLIEHLDIIAVTLLKMFDLRPGLKELPTSLIHLKDVYFRDVWLFGNGLRFVLLLIKCSPNLERIRLFEFYSYSSDENLTSAGVLEEYSDVWLEHLNELEIESEYSFKHQINFVKFILARSPKLKKVRVSLDPEVVQQKSDILKVLLQIPCASPVEFVVA